jgi:hypothetical protein
MYGVGSVSMRICSVVVGFVYGAGTRRERNGPVAVGAPRFASSSPDTACVGEHSLCVHYLSVSIVS